MCDDVENPMTELLWAKWADIEPLHEITRAPLPSREVFEALYANVSKPVIFTDVVNKWPALEIWSLEWFKNQHGDCEVPIQFTEIDMPRNKKETSRAYGVQSFFSLRDHIDSVLSDNQEKGYLSSFNLFKLIPSLLENVSFPKFYSFRFMTLYSSWIGVGGSKVHCDYAHNLFAQISGKKIFQLYSPNSHLKRYPARWSWYSCFCQMDFDFFKPLGSDKEVFDQLKPDYNFEIHPGEMLFIPHGWWHRVLTPKPTLSVNQWWMTPKMLMARIPWMPLDYGQRVIRRVKAFITGKPPGAHI